VQDVSIGAEAGKIVTLIGPNGAGKSTFLKVIAGVLPATTGSVKVEGREIANLPANRVARLGLAYVPQEANVFPTLTIRENLEMGGFILRGELGHRIVHLYELFPDLKAAERKKAGNLSGGQRNMLAMARALMLDPKVLLLDEPTAGLSPIYTDVVWQKVHAIADTGTAVVVVEQNVYVAEAVVADLILAAIGHGRCRLRPERMQPRDVLLRTVAIVAPDPRRHEAATIGPDVPEAAGEPHRPGIVACPGRGWQEIRHGRHVGSDTISIDGGVERHSPTAVGASIAGRPRKSETPLMCDEPVQA
jgi:ABC-type branched-subunit amino acid transport system ATPase component